MGLVSIKTFKEVAMGVYIRDGRKIDKESRAIVLHSKEKIWNRSGPSRNKSYKVQRDRLNSEGSFEKIKRDGLWILLKHNQ